MCYLENRLHCLLQKVLLCIFAYDKSNTPFFSTGELFKKHKAIIWKEKKKNTIRPQSSIIQMIGYKVSFSSHLTERKDKCIVFYTMTDRKDIIKISFREISCNDMWVSSGRYNVLCFFFMSCLCLHSSLPATDMKLKYESSFSFSSCFVLMTTTTIIPKTTIMMVQQYNRMHEYRCLWLMVIIYVMIVCRA